MDKINIVFILGALEIGGTERQFLETIRRLDRDRFRLHVLALPCYGKLREEIEKLAIPFTCLNFSGIAGKYRVESYCQLWRLFRDMVRFFRREQPHITQSYLFWANIYGSLAAKIAGVPVIATGRREIPDNDLQSLHYRWLQNLSNYCASTIIANSQGAKSQCLTQEKYVNDRKIHVIYNGIEPNSYTFHEKNDRKKREFHIPEDCHVIGIIARLRRYKGLRDFLAAADLVAQTHPKTTFLIIGRDDEGIQTELEMLAKDLHICDSVMFMGERDDIPQLLPMLDVQVSASWTESASNAILEGMAAGIPLVATDVGGTAELVIHEQTGLLVPPRNPERLASGILRLLEDQKLRRQLGHNARQRAATMFPMEVMIEQTEALYTQLYLHTVSTLSTWTK